jgi:hypothetical protein
LQFSSSSYLLLRRFCCYCNGDKEEKSFFFGRAALRCDSLDTTLVTEPATTALLDASEGTIPIRVFFFFFKVFFGMPNCFSEFLFIFHWDLIGGGGNFLGGGQKWGTTGTGLDVLVR